MFATGAFGVFCHWDMIFIFRLPIPKQESIIEVKKKKHEPETVVWIQNKKTAAQIQPVTQSLVRPEQLSELAENITQGKKTLAINQWEGVGLCYPSSNLARAGMVTDVKLCLLPKMDQLIPTDDLLNFFCALVG